MDKFITICLALIIVPIFMLMFFAPTIIAGRRHAENFVWIVLANLVGGLTGVGWIVVLIRALYAPPALEGRR